MFLAQYDLLEKANKVDEIRIRIKNMITRSNHWAFDLPDSKFIKTYRLTKPLATKLIFDLSQSNYLRDSFRAYGLDPATKILSTLSLYACGGYQTSIGDSKMHCISQPSMPRAVHAVTMALNDLAPKYIKFPTRPEEINATQQRFYKLGRIPGVLGCIDGTHVSIISPSHHEERFVNRKGYHSLNVMLICDADLQITAVDPSYPGSTHDSTIWNNHPIKYHLQQLSANSNDHIYLLGTFAYYFLSSILYTCLKQ